MSGCGQKRSKSWYRKQAYHNKRHKAGEDSKGGPQFHRLAPGLRGFAITCNERERDAVRECYNILNEYADQLYGPEVKDEAGEGEMDDIDAAFASEVQSLKDAAASDNRRFQNCKTGANNVIFIKTALEDPVSLAHSIFTDLQQTKTQKAKNALRLLPVVGTCKATVKDISNTCKDVLKPFFSDISKTVSYSLAFKARNNHGLGRDMVINSLKTTIPETFGDELVQFTHVDPEIWVQIEVICGVACICVAKEYNRFRKYNLVEVVSDKKSQDSGGGKSENVGKEGEKSENVGKEEEKSENVGKEGENSENVGKEGDKSENGGKEGEKSENVGKEGEKSDNEGKEETVVSHKGAKDNTQNADTQLVSDSKEREPEPSTETSAPKAYNDQKLSESKDSSSLTEKENHRDQDNRDSIVNGDGKES